MAGTDSSLARQKAAGRQLVVAGHRWRLKTSGQAPARLGLGRCSTAGWLGEHFGLRATLALAGAVSTLLVLLAWRSPVIYSVRELPRPVPQPLDGRPA